MATTILNLDKYKGSFKSLEDFELFASEFAKLAVGEMALIVRDDRLLATLFPAEEAQKRLQEQIIKRLATEPELLDTLQKRLESDDLVS